jgi:hypothetical protein
MIADRTNEASVNQPCGRMTGVLSRFCGEDSMGAKCFCAVLHRILFLVRLAHGHAVLSIVNRRIDADRSRDRLRSELPGVASHGSVAAPFGRTIPKPWSKNLRDKIDLGQCSRNGIPSVANGGKSRRTRLDFPGRKPRQATRIAMEIYQVWAPTR